MGAPQFIISQPERARSNYSDCSGGAWLNFDIDTSIGSQWVSQYAWRLGFVVLSEVGKCTEAWNCSVESDV